MPSKRCTGRRRSRCRWCRRCLGRPRRSRRRHRPRWAPRTRRCVRPWCRWPPGSGVLGRIGPGGHESRDLGLQIRQGTGQDVRGVRDGGVDLRQGAVDRVAHPSGETPVSGVRDEGERTADDLAGHPVDLPVRMCAVEAHLVADSLDPVDLAGAGAATRQRQDRIAIVGLGLQVARAAVGGLADVGLVRVPPAVGGGPDVCRRDGERRLDLAARIRDLPQPREQRSTDPVVAAGDRQAVMDPQGGAARPLVEVEPADRGGQAAVVLVAVGPHVAVPDRLAFESGERLPRRCREVGVERDRLARHVLLPRFDERWRQAPSNLRGVRAGSKTAPVETARVDGVDLIPRIFARRGDGARHARKSGRVLRRCGRQAHAGEDYSSQPAGGGKHLGPRAQSAGRDRHPGDRRFPTVIGTARR